MTNHFQVSAEINEGLLRRLFVSQRFQKDLSLDLMAHRQKISHLIQVKLLLDLSLHVLVLEEVLGKEDIVVLSETGQDDLVDGVDQALSLWLVRRRASVHDV